MPGAPHTERARASGEDPRRRLRHLHARGRPAAARRRSRHCNGRPVERRQVQSHQRADPPRAGAGRRQAGHHATRQSLCRARRAGGREAHHAVDPRRPAGIRFRPGRTGSASRVRGDRAGLLRAGNAARSLPPELDGPAPGRRHPARGRPAPGTRQRRGGPGLARRAGPPEHRRHDEERPPVAQCAGPGARAGTKRRSAAPSSRYPAGPAPACPRSARPSDRC